MTIMKYGDYRIYIANNHAEPYCIEKCVRMPSGDIAFWQQFSKNFFSKKSVLKVWDTLRNQGFIV